MATSSSQQESPINPDIDSRSVFAVKYHIQGYDVSLVQQPPKEIQLECSICLQFLSDPWLTDCDCGKSFCRACIESIQEMNHPCPQCNQQFGAILPNRQLSSILNSLQIYCPHKEQGCQWTDEMGRLFEHMNNTPTTENRLDGCEFAFIPCKFCNEVLARTNIPHHETNICPDRRYTCQYCDYTSINNDITDNHWPVCSRFPVICPLDCGETLERQNIEIHVGNQCQNALIECDFNFGFSGCTVKLPRKDMPAHLRENVVDHMSLLAVNSKHEIKNL